jgi:hypothetical protein
MTVATVSGFGALRHRVPVACSGNAARRGSTHSARSDSESTFVGVLHRDMKQADGDPTRPSPEEIMEDGEDPSARTAVGTSLVPMGDRSFQAILHKIVGRRMVPRTKLRA